MGTLAAKVTSGVFICLILLGCTQKGNILYLPDPEEPRISTAPLVTVIYDLICQGVEEAAARHGLRTMQQSPLSYEEGLAYLHAMFPAYPGFARLPFECNPVREPVPQRTRRIYTLP